MLPTGLCYNTHSYLICALMFNKRLRYHNISRYFALMFALMFALKSFGWYNNIIPLLYNCIYVHAMLSHCEYKINK